MPLLLGSISRHLNLSTRVKSSFALPREEVCPTLLLYILVAILASICQDRDDHERGADLSFIDEHMENIAAVEQISSAIVTGDRRCCDDYRMT